MFTVMSTSIAAIFVICIMALCVFLSLLGLALIVSILDYFLKKWANFKNKGPKA